MILPAAQVTIQIDRVDLADDVRADLETATQPYFLVRIGRRRLGRSRVVPAGATSFTFAEERIRWSHEIRVAAGEGIPIEVELWSADEGTYPLASFAVLLPDPWTFGPHVDANEELAVHYRVWSRPVPQPVTTGVAPRATPNTTTQATLRIPDTALVELTDIVGAYEPEPAPKAGKPRARRRVGYLAEDDAGRVYLNRRLDGSFRADRQLVEVHAEIHVLRGFLPDDAKVRWTVVDVDDPTNDDPDVHPEAGAYIDGKDYDPNTGVHLGSMGFDNEGTFDRDPRWEPVLPYALSIDSETQAKTAIVKNRSVVRIHCTNVGGDSFLVRADIVSDAPLESFSAETGILSMWDRIDVEYVKMVSADPLPVEDVPPILEPAFVQLDFTLPRTVADEAVVGQTWDEANRALGRFVERRFSMNKTAGWFCLISALQWIPAPSPKDVVYEGPITLHVEPVAPFKTTFTIPGEHKDVFVATMYWWDASDQPTVHRAEFLRLTADPAPFIDDPYEPVTIFEVGYHDYFPLVHANTETFFFGPRHQFRRGEWEKGGYGIGQANVVCHSMNSREVDGISHGVAGRTVIFTKAKKDPETGVVPPHIVAYRASVIAHELVHALGFEHKCGNWDLRLPRKNPCFMNYRGQWLLRWKTLADVQLDPDTGDEDVATGTSLCATHAREIRRVHLEDNPELKWK